MEQQAEGNSSKDNYLRYTKLEAGKPANFALLEEDPLCYWLVWADGTDGSASNAGDNIIFDRTNADGDDIGDKLMAELGAEVILDQSAGGLLTQEDGDIIYFEDGTHSSLLGIAPAFLPLGFEAESFDNTSRTSFDNSSQTYDVLEGF